MQIIYSAGTASPTSPRASPLPSPRRPKSPRSPRHLQYYEGWRPVMPGYKAPPSHHHPPTVVIQRTVEVQHLSDQSDTNLKDSIPDMPKALAVTCLICNILIPGLGTLVSGLSVLCCSKPRPSTRDKSSILWVNSWVALFQFLTTFLCLLGWIWSIMWGVAFLTISGRSKSPDDPSGDPAVTSSSTTDADQTPASHRHHQRTTNSRTTTTTTVSVPGNHGNQGDAAPDGLSPASAPIIILQEAPIIIPPQPAASDAASGAGDAGSGATGGGGGGQRGTRTLNPYNPRHQRALRREEGELLPSVLLTPDTLEELVLHNAPLPDPAHDGPPLASKG